MGLTRCIADAKRRLAGPPMPTRSQRSGGQPGAVTLRTVQRLRHTDAVPFEHGLDHLTGSLAG